MNIPLIWMPFLQDTKNIGLKKDLSYSYISSTQQEGGKLGKYCYSDCGIIHLPNDIIDNQWTLSTWVKSTGWGQWNDIIFCKNATASTSCQFYFSIVGGTKLNLGINGDGGAGTGAGSYSYTFNTDTWYHVAATYDGTKYAMYINGSVVKSGNYTSTKLTDMNNIGIGCRATTAAGGGPTGYGSKRFNDARIYNICLSAAEIKEISQGLCLHYTFQNYTNPNLLNGNINTTAQWTKEPSTTVLEQGADYLKITVGNATSKRIYNTVSNVWNANQVYTVSFEAKTDTDGATIKPSRSQNGGTNTTGAFTLSREWKHYSGQITSTQTVTGGTLTLDLAPAGAIIYIRNVKLEKGDVETGFCLPGVNNNNIIYDSSGWNNNSTLTGTNIYTTSTNNLGRYDKCVYLGSAQNDPLVVLKNPSNLLPALSTTTITWWGKYNTANANTLVLSNSAQASSYYVGAMRANTQSLYCGGGAGGTAAACYRDALEISKYNSSSGVNIFSTTDWHFYCVRGADLSGWTGLKMNEYSGYPYNGYIADLRIYNTLLSDDDILNIYQSPFLLDNRNNLHAPKIRERDISDINLFKNGVYDNSDIFEMDNIIAFKNIPSDYTIYEYLQGSSNGQINLGLKFNLETQGCKVKFQSIQTTGNHMIFASSGGNYFWVYDYSNTNQNNTYFTSSGVSQQRTNNLSPRDTRIHEYLWVNKRIYIDGQRIYGQSGNSTFDNLTLSTTTNNMYAFSYGGSYYYTGKIFEIQIFENNGNMLYYFIPAKRNSDSAYGFYDIVNSTFIAGTGTFTPGPIVNGKSCTFINNLIEY